MSPELTDPQKLTDSLSIIESQERANIDMLIATAKKYPRNLVRVKQNMEAMATLDQETAEACNYHLSRDGHSIEGPGVRMAEIAVSCYQNIRSGSRVIANDGKVITGQAFCHDLENNIFIAWETQRRITDRHGRTYSEDMQVTTGNAAAAIAFRNAVFKVIPGAIVRSVADSARRMAIGDINTLEQRWTRALKKFAALGVNEARILGLLLKRSAKEITVDDIDKLFGIYTAIRDQTTTVEEQFPPNVVPPNFADTPATPQSHTQKRRGRPPKAAPENLFGPSAELAESAPLGEQKEPLKSPEALEVLARLEAENIPLKHFLHVMEVCAFLSASQEDIERGLVGIESVSPEGLSRALEAWGDVKKMLPITK